MKKPVYYEFVAGRRRHILAGRGAFGSLHMLCGISGEYRITCLPDQSTQWPVCKRCQARFDRQRKGEGE